MKSVSFPFKIENGKVSIGDEINEKVKRVIHYSTSDLAYCPGVGAGIGDLVFAVGANQSIKKVIKRNIMKSLISTNEIEKANVIFNHNDNKTTISIFYQVSGEPGTRIYKIN